MNQDDSLVRGHQKKVKEDMPVCQFYILVGNHEREFRNSVKCQFFKAVPNVRDIVKGMKIVCDKRRNMQAIAEHLIFLIPDETYFDEARELMNQLDRGGKIQIVPKRKVKTPPPVRTRVVQEVKEEKKEEVVEAVSKERKEDAVRQEEKLESNKVDNTVSNNNVLIHHDDVLVKKSVPSVPVLQNVASSLDDEKDNDAASYMWGDEKGAMLDNDKSKKKEKSKEKKLVKNKKSKAFIDLPVIIFILSAFLLIGSIILLFVLK